MRRYISPFESVLGGDRPFPVLQTDQALDLIRREWGQMVTHDPTGSVWEKMTTTAASGRIGDEPGRLADR